MTKRSFVVIVLLSLLVTFIADILDGLVNNTFIGGKSGFPFKDSLSMGFEGGTSYPHMFALNVIFWFVVIWGIWKLLQKASKRKK